MLGGNNEDPLWCYITDSVTPGEKPANLERLMMSLTVMWRVR